MTAVTVLGTGIMGAGMAANLAKAGLDTTVWNRTLAKARPLADLGAGVAEDPSDAVSGADVVVTMLFDANAVADVMERALPAAKDSVIWVQSATVGIDGTERLAALARKYRVAFVDAPVLGTRQPAELVFPYAFRHTFAQRHPDAGTPVDTLKELLGHDTVRATLGYYRYSDRQAQARRPGPARAAAQIGRDLIKFSFAALERIRGRRKISARQHGAPCCHSRDLLQFSSRMITQGDYIIGVACLGLTLRATCGAVVFAPRGMRRPASSAFRTRAGRLPSSCQCQRRSAPESTSWPCSTPGGRTAAASSPSATWTRSPTASVMSSAASRSSP